MAFPAQGTVPTTSTDGAAVEIDTPTLDPLTSAEVDSGADIARNATRVAAGYAATPAELDGAVQGNETAFAVLETYYRDPQAAADRLATLNPMERDALAEGKLEVLGKLRDTPATVELSGGGTVPTDLDRETLGAGLAAFGQNRVNYQTAFDQAEEREADRAQGREPDAERDERGAPVVDVDRPNDGGQAPSTSGQGGIAPDARGVAGEKAGKDSVQEEMEGRVKAYSLGPQSL